MIFFPRQIVRPQHELTPMKFAAKCLGDGQIPGTEKSRAIKHSRYGSKGFNGQRSVNEIM
jgi:hypothetical protein